MRRPPLASPPPTAHRRPASLSLVLTLAALTLVTLSVQGCYLGGDAYSRGGITVVRFDSGAPADSRVSVDIDAGPFFFPDTGDKPTTEIDSGIVVVDTGALGATDGSPSGCGVCTPGQIGTGLACGNCGVQRRVCQPDCTWSPYVCEGEGVCARGRTQPCTNNDPCGQERCTNDCQWSACEPIEDVGLDGCLYINPSTGVSGGNFRCCTVMAQPGWQFCLRSTCRFSPVCEANAACN